MLKKEILIRSSYQDAQFIIERAGRPMAAVVPVWKLEEWQKYHDRAQRSLETIKDRKRLRKQGKA